MEVGLGGGEREQIKQGGVKKGRVKGKGLEGHSVVMMTLLIGSYLSLKITTTKKEKTVIYCQLCLHVKPATLALTLYRLSYTHGHTQIHAICLH